MKEPHQCLGGIDVSDLGVGHSTEHVVSIQLSGQSRHIVHILRLA